MGGEQDRAANRALAVLVIAIILYFFTRTFL